MATDIYCPHQDCKHIRKSGLCGKGILALEATSHDDTLTCTDTCTDYEKRTKQSKEAE